MISLDKNLIIDLVNNLVLEKNLLIFDGLKKNAVKYSELLFIVKSDPKMVIKTFA
jgi:hypothetical protein